MKKSIHRKKAEFMFFTLILENETGLQIDLSKTANRFMFSKIEGLNPPAGTISTSSYAGMDGSYLNNAFIWDTQFFQTLWKLIRRPGHLTTEFLSGKFTSQEHPLKLNMFLLFVTITLFALFSSSEKVTDSVNSVLGNETTHINVGIANIAEVTD